MKPSDKEDQAQPAMPFNEALKRVWAAKPMPKVKPKQPPPLAEGPLTPVEKKLVNKKAGH